jgi:hypothetical protein
MATVAKGSEADQRCQEYCDRLDQFVSQSPLAELTHASFLRIGLSDHQPSYGSDNMRFMLLRSAGELAMMDLGFVFLIAGAAATKKPPRVKDAGRAGRCPGGGELGLATARIEQGCYRRGRHPARFLIARERRASQGNP